MKKRLKAVCILALCFSIMGTSSGCGRKEVEYNPSATEDNVQDDSDNDDINTMNHDLMKTLGAGEEWEATFDANYSKVEDVSIDVVAQVPDVKNVRTIGARAVDFTPELKKKFIELLSEGTVYLAGEEHRIKSDVKNDIEGVERIIDELKRDMEGVTYASDDPEVLLEEYSELLEELKIEYENVPDDYVVADGNYDTDYYVVEYNGMRYKLDFFLLKKGGEGISFYPLDTTECLDDDNYRYACTIPDDLRYGQGENKCNLSIEEIDRISEDFLRRLGLTDFKAVSYQNLEWSTDKGVWCDGCHVRLCRNIDGAALDDKDYCDIRYFALKAHEYIEYDEEGEPTKTYVNNYMPEYIDLDINSDGVISMNWAYPLELTGENYDVEPIPFENAKEILADLAVLHGPEEYDVTGDTSIKYNTLEFMYFRSREEGEGSYRFIPVWRLSYVKADSVMRCIIMNAVDGSYVDVVEELLY